MRTLHRPTLIAALAVAACGGSEPPALTVDEIAYSEDELLGLPTERRETLAHLAAFGLAVADSTTMELGAPRIERWVDDRRLEILDAELLLEEREIGDDVLEGRYMTDPRWELTVRHILFFSERWRPAEHREQARAKAARAMDLLRGGADFPRTAAELSEEPGAEGREGLLTPGREGSWVPEFWAAAVALEPGEISPVTETQYGYHILRLEDRTVVPFEEARSTVARDVARQLDEPGAALDRWLSERVGGDADARREAALAEADRRGIEVQPQERTEIERQWDDQTYRWAMGLGFGYGMTAEQVRAAALEALSRSGQNAGIARTELDRNADLLERHAEIQVRTGT
jgi:parvulin-like peptidyl-prolyl isomerase